MTRKGPHRHLCPAEKSQFLAPAAHRFVYVPFLTEKQLLGALLEGQPLKADTLYVITGPEKQDCCFHLAVKSFISLSHKNRGCEKNAFSHPRH